MKVIFGIVKRGFFSYRTRESRVCLLVVRWGIESG